ncbi:hypothetical protein [Sediminimonas sp.]|uniref:hypothetical protein n=1 Tax=Sediminimonas sp. TaxID=2823379 RepID=UPI0025CE8699|nr:hypothetical protein [Sediminimonas sp.]
MNMTLARKEFTVESATGSWVYSAYREDGKLFHLAHRPGATEDFVDIDYTSSQFIPLDVFRMLADMGFPGRRDARCDLIRPLRAQDVRMMHDLWKLRGAA